MSKDEKKIIISAESAEDSLNKFYDYYEMSPKDLKGKLSEAIEMAEDRIKKAIMKGKVEIIEADGVININQHLQTGTILTYGEISGKTKIAMSGKEDTDHYGRLYSLVGALTGLSEAAILKLRGQDMSLAECIGSLFLQV